ncbi:MAG: cardiolipin synthase [Planctomycetes bacterium]|nr:cardiolipin synthase [Planctomycetota bacterium]
MHWWQTLGVELSALVGVVLIVITIPWVLILKKESTSAVAWCLLVFFLPYVGSLLFLIFGYQHVHRPLRRKQKFKKYFRSTNPGRREEATPGLPARPDAPAGWEAMARLAQRLEAFPLTHGNQVQFFEEGKAAFTAMLEAIRAARHHVHLLSYVVQPDASGQLFLEALTQKARQGIEVRLLYDAMGSYRFRHRILRPLLAAGARGCSFLPLSPGRRLQVNLRNHRKILVVDGQVGFTGGLNIGDEYAGLDAGYGYWRDSHLRVEGPAVAGLQFIFLEDWHFAAGEQPQGPAYFPEPRTDGPYPVQVIFSGPDQDLNSIREIYFAAILRARRRLWIATPYFVPDASLRDALALAGRLGLDVRILCQYHPDQWVPFFASRYYWAELLKAGVQVYQYTRGMMHSKVMVVDGEWASVGTANLDNRSLHLNFEDNCLIYSAQAAAELERAFVADLKYSIRLKREVFAQRSFASRLVENGCRLLSPIL